MAAASLGIKLKKTSRMPSESNDSFASSYAAPKKSRVVSQLGSQISDNFDEDDPAKSRMQRSKNESEYERKEREWREEMVRKDIATEASELSEKRKYEKKAKKPIADTSLDLPQPELIDIDKLLEEAAEYQGTININGGLFEQVGPQPQDKSKYMPETGSTRVIGIQLKDY